MARERPPHPLDSGRNAYREPTEPPDDRPIIIRTNFREAYRRTDSGLIVQMDGKPPGDPLWKDTTERLTYENAVECNPRKEGEGATSYLRRLSEVVARRYAEAPPPAQEEEPLPWRKQIPGEEW